MEHLTASTSPGPFSGENGFDPLEDAIRFRVRAFIEALMEEQAQAALGRRGRYQRRAARPRAIATATGSGSTFGALRVSLPRVRLLGGDGREGDGRET